MKQKIKTAFLLLVSLVISCFSLAPMSSQSVSAADYFNKLTKDDTKIIDAQNIQDPLRDGAYEGSAGVNGLYMKYGRIGSFLDAQNATLAYAQNIINWTLAIIGAIALVYLLFTGFKMVTASGDESKFKKWTQSLRNAIIALVGVGLSALIVNFIIYLIDQIMK